MTEAWTFSLSISYCQESCEDCVVKVKVRTCCAGINTCLQKPGGSTTICSSWFTLVLWPQFLTAVGASLHFGLTQEQCRQHYTRPAEQSGEGGQSVGAARISNNEAVEEHWINIRVSWAGRASPTWQSCEMTLSIGVNWTPASGFEAAPLPWGNQGP